VLSALLAGAIATIGFGLLSWRSTAGHSREEHQRRTASPPTYVGEATCAGYHGQLHHYELPIPMVFFRCSTSPVSRWSATESRHRLGFTRENRGRPLISVAYRVPNACSQCNKGKSSAWAGDAVVKWYGPNRRREVHFVESLDAGRRGLAVAEKALAFFIVDSSQAGIAPRHSVDSALAIPQPYFAPCGADRTCSTKSHPPADQICAGPGPKLPSINADHSRDAGPGNHMDGPHPRKNLRSYLLNRWTSCFVA
jgi:hypothetical protein